MLFKSQFLQQASGSLGGVVYSHNRGGQYTRQRSIPTNPATTRQQAVRAIMSGLVQNWTEDLTPVEREAWDIYGQNVPVSNKLGDQVFLTGQNWFIGNNVPRLQAGLARVDTAPTVFDQGPPVQTIDTINQATPLTIGIESPNMSSTFTLSAAAPTDGDLLIYLGPPVNASRNFFKGPYQLTDVLTVASAATTTAWSSLISALQNSNGAPANGQTRGLRAIVVYDDGRVSPSTSLLLPVANDPV